MLICRPTQCHNETECKTVDVFIYLVRLLFISLRLFTVICLHAWLAFRAVWMMGDDVTFDAAGNNRRKTQQQLLCSNWVYFKSHDAIAETSALRRNYRFVVNNCVNYVCVVGGDSAADVVGNTGHRLVQRDDGALKQQRDRPPSPC